MASPVPAKSQPLHYFSLPQLKWKNNHNHNHTNNHQRGRSRFAGSSPNRSPIIDSASESDSVQIKNGFGSERRKNFAPTSDFSEEKSDKKSEIKSTVQDVDLAGGKERKSKIYIRLPKKKADEVPEEGKVPSMEGETDESVPKTWNLRPRRPLHKQFNGNGGTGTHKIGVSPMPEHKSQSPVHQNWPEIEVNTVEKKEKKHKFSISLSREEIEEDIFALTGSKPSRRPKKRPRALQKQLDNLFPGLWLGMITPDSYKVSDAPPKV